MENQPKKQKNKVIGFCGMGLSIGVALVSLTMSTPAQAAQTPPAARPAALPVPYVANVTKLTQGTSIQNAFCAVTADKGLLCWGKNFSGELGVGDREAYTTPVRALITDVVEVAGTAYGMCALLSDTTVKCWGDGSQGQLGTGQLGYEVSSTLPVQVLDYAGGPALRGVTQISSGFSRTCARMDTGIVRCWGDNGWGELGDGTTVARSIPVTVTGLSNVAAVSAGNFHTCALMNDGTVRCWGENQSTLGDGTTVDSLTPVQVHGVDDIGFLTNVISITAAYRHTCAILGTSQSVCWGDELLGNAVRTGDIDADSSVPTYTVDGALQPLTGVGQHSGGEYDSCLRLVDGTPLCWGHNYAGELGLGHQDEILTPTAMMIQSGETLTDVVDIVMGSENSCALTASGHVYCLPADNDLAALVIVPPAKDADLLDLTVSPGVLAPAFVSSTTNYTVGVPNGTTSATVAATTSDVSATVVYSSSAGSCTPGNATPSNCVVAGPKTWITTTVTAADGTTTKQYFIEITVAALATPTATPTVTPTATPTVTPTVTPTATPAPTQTPGVLAIGNVWPKTGVPTGGMPVSLFGSGFTGAYSVTVDGQPVEFEVLDDGRIDITAVPSGTNFDYVDFVVTTPAGSVTAEQAYQYVANSTGEVPATGGVITTASGATVTVPALGYNFVLTYTPVSPPIPPLGNVLMYVFRLDAELNWIPVSEISQPITIELPVDPSIVPNGERPWLYVFVPIADRQPPTADRRMDDGRRTMDDGGRTTAVGGQWALVPGQTYDPATMRVTVHLSRMKTYALSTLLLYQHYVPQVGPYYAMDMK